MPELFQDMLNDDNSIFNAAIKDNEMLKRAIDRLHNETEIKEDPNKIKEIDASYDDLIRDLTIININSNRIQNFIDHRSYSGPLEDDMSVDEYNENRDRKLKSVADNDASINLILTTIDKMRGAIKIVKKNDGFPITISQSGKIKTLIDRFNDLLNRLNTKGTFLSVYLNHEDLFNSFIRTGNQLIQYTRFYTTNDIKSMNFSYEDIKEDHGGNDKGDGKGDGNGDDQGDDKGDGKGDDKGDDKGDGKGYNKVDDSDDDYDSGNDGGNSNSDEKSVPEDVLIDEKDNTGITHTELAGTYDIDVGAHKVDGDEEEETGLKQESLAESTDLVVKPHKVEDDEDDGSVKHDELGASSGWGIGNKIRGLIGYSGNVEETKADKKKKAEEAEAKKKDDLLKRKGKAFEEISKGRKFNKEVQDRKSKKDLESYYEDLKETKKDKTRRSMDKLGFLLNQFEDDKLIADKIKKDDLLKRKGKAFEEISKGRKFNKEVQDKKAKKDLESYYEDLKETKKDKTRRTMDKLGFLLNQFEDNKVIADKIKKDDLLKRKGKAFEEISKGRKFNKEVQDKKAKKDLESYYEDLKETKKDKTRRTMDKLGFLLNQFEDNKVIADKIKKEKGIVKKEASRLNEEKKIDLTKLSVEKKVSGDDVKGDVDVSPLTVDYVEPFDDKGAEEKEVVDDYEKQDLRELMAREYVHHVGDPMKLGSAHTAFLKLNKDKKIRDTKLKKAIEGKDDLVIQKEKSNMDDFKKRAERVSFTYGHLLKSDYDILKSNAKLERDAHSDESYQTAVKQLEKYTKLTFDAKGDAKKTEEYKANMALKGRFNTKVNKAEASIKELENFEKKYNIPKK